MTDYFAIMLVISLPGSEGATADVAAEVFKMVFLFGGSDIRITQRASAAVANEVKSPEEVGFAIKCFVFGIVLINKKL